MDRSAEPVADVTSARVDEDEFAEPVTGTLPVQAADDEEVAEPVADAVPARVDEPDEDEPVVGVVPVPEDEDEPVVGVVPVPEDEGEPVVELLAEPVDTAPERADEVDLFAEPVADTAPEPPDGVDLPTGTAPTRPDGGPPRGLTSDGSVRTTGWLQVGDHPVSSALLATLAGLLWALVAAAVLVSEYPVAAGVLTLTVPVACGVLWWLLTTWLRPASTARNVETCRADELEPGDVVRLHGSIGPVGRVTEVVVGEDVRVVLHGGNERTWAPDQTVHLAELLS